MKPMESLERTVMGSAVQTGLAGRLGNRLDEVRDRLAAAIAGDEVRGELAGLRRAVNDLDARTAQLATGVSRRLEALAEVVDAAADDLSSAIERQGRSWFRRLLWIVLGAAAGVATAALADPAAGARRRKQVRDQVAARARDLAGDAARQARYAAGVAKGAAIETAKDVLVRQARPADPETLRQRIRSEVVGQVDGADDVVVAVHAGGRVTLKGAVSSEDTERRLVEATRALPGISEVTSELNLRLP